MISVLEYHNSCVTLSICWITTPSSSYAYSYSLYLYNYTRFILNIIEFEIRKKYCTLCLYCFPLGGCHLVLGKTGSGKSALVSNWLQNVKKKKSHDLIYHFAGCSRDSTRRYIHVLLKAAVYGKFYKYINRLERASYFPSWN